VEGDAADLPPAPHVADGWQLGPPDLIVQIPQPYRLALADPALAEWPVLVRNWSGGSGLLAR
jgi:hypothetical protein